MEFETPKNNNPEVDCHRALKINEILLKIVDSIDLNDLCSFSRTCKQNWAISKKHFEKKYFMKYLLITQQSDETIKVLNEESYTRHFMKHIQNVIVRGMRFGPNLRVFSYFGDNCCQYLKEIRFEYINFNSDQMLCIQKNLENVKTVTFTSCQIDGNIYSNFLVFCPEIQHLVFARTELRCNDVDVWLSGECPKLESFHLKIRRKADCVYWNKFFERNPNVARLSTIFLEGDHPVMRQMCRQIATKAIKLKRLCLSVSEDFELDAIEGELKDLNDKESFEQLEMEFDGSHITTLTRNHRLFSILKKFKGIYFDGVVDTSGLFSAIDRIHTVKTLILEYVESYAYNESDILENILFRSSLAPVSDIIRHYLTNLPKLKMIVVYEYLTIEQITELDLLLIWCNKIELEGKRPVDVFVCHRSPNDVKLLLSATDNNKRLFKLKIFTDEQRYNFFRENPFIQHLDPGY